MLINIFRVLLKLIMQKGGSAIVLDNISGEILAIASYPSYNPNSPKRQIKRNRALVDAFEPGSIIKPLALAKGIDMGIVSKNQVIDTSPGFINLSGRTISDPKNYHNLTASEIIAKSSQVGASKLALQVGIDGLISGYKGFGLSKPPNIFFFLALHTVLLTLGRMSLITKSPVLDLGTA